MIILGIIFDLPFIKKINHLFQYLFITFYPLILKKYLKKSMQIYPRHSVKSAHDFNLFFSDVDFSFVLDSVDEETIALIKHRYYKIKKVLINLGEFEIYNNEEFDLLNESLNLIGTDYSFLRNFRKSIWYYPAYLQAKKLYDKYKIKRSLIKNWQKAGQKNSLILSDESQFYLGWSQALGKWLQQLDKKEYLQNVPAPAADIFTYSCPYLCAALVVEPRALQNWDKTKPFVYLPLQEGLLLLSVLPPNYENIKSEVEIIRTHKTIKDLRFHLTRIEFLNFQAAIRGFLKTDEAWIKKWYDLLKDLSHQ